MKKYLLLWALLFSAPLYGQYGNTYITQSASDPTGNACNFNQFIITPTSLYDCPAHVYALISGGSGGAGAFSTLSASGAVSGVGFSNYLASPPAIGATAPNAGAFSTLSASGAVSGVGFSNYLASPPAIGATAPNAGAFSTLSASGAVSGVGFSNYLASPPAIGATAPNAGAFSTLSASGAVSGVGFSNYLASPPAIGATAPNAGAFSTLSASGAVSGVGFSNYLASPPAIGATAPNAGSFSSINEGTSNTPLTINAGLDGAVQASSAYLALRGQSITSGSTGSLTGGEVLVQGGNNSSSGNTSAGGVGGVAGGDVSSTGSSGAAGGGIVRGGNCTNATGSCGPGYGEVMGGNQTGGGTNTQGGDVYVTSGQGTGSALASHIILQGVAYSQTSGTAAQTLIKQYITLKKAGSTSSASATNMFSVPATGNPAAGGMVIVHVYTTQAAPHTCSNTGMWEFAVQNEGPAASLNRVDATVTTICDTGTMTMTAAMTNANPSVFSVTPSWTVIVPTAVWIDIVVINPGDTDITPVGD